MSDKSEEVYNIVFNTLGSDLKDPPFQMLIERVGQPSSSFELDLGNGSVDQVIEFRHLGLGISYDKQKRKIWMVGFEFATPSVKQGRQLPFPYAVHAGILSTDDRDTVAKKFGDIKGLSSDGKVHRDKYVISPRVFDCKFSGPEGPLEAMTVYMPSVKEQD